MNPTLIRPGLLVSLRSTLRGGVQYEKTTIEPEHAEGKALVAAWTTRRQIEDAAEHAAAVVARGAARSAITRVCSASNFGLLCRQDREEELRDAITQAREIAAAHNRAARLTRVDLYVVCGRVAADDAEAARAIGAEVRELLNAMESAIRAADPEAIRENANKARALSGMLTDDAARKVSAAVAEVRKIAREIVRTAGESASVAAQVVQGLRLEALQSARFAVLDLAGETEEREPLPVPGRAVDLEPEGPTALAAAPEVSPTLDLF